MNQEDNAHIYIWKPLDSKVLAVAIITKGINDWTAYIGAVKGQNHEQEWLEVASNGSKLAYSWAKVLFPEIPKNCKWRE